MPPGTGRDHLYQVSAPHDKIFAGPSRRRDVPSWEVMSDDPTSASSVRTVRFDAGDNRINRDFVDRLDAALDEVEADAGIGAMITTGRDRFYSTGLDLDWLLAADAEPMREFVADVERVFARVMALPVITIAACNGHAFAAGAMLALAHDFRVMRVDRGFFCLPEVDVKIPFTPGMDALVRARLPARVAHEAMVTGKRYGGAEAARKHIVHEAVPEHLLLERAGAIAAEHGGKDREALERIKERMYEPVLARLRNSPGTEPLSSG